MMNSIVLKLIILSCLIFQMGCELKLKRKSTQPQDNQAEMLEFKKLSSEKPSTSESTADDFQFSSKDSQIITLYFSDKTNAIIRHDMMMSTQVSKKQKKNLVVGGYIIRDIQVMPLPLKLEKMLSSLSLDFLRVQVANNVILMNVKSRKILDIIKI